ncbi:MAG: O-antigen ligase family protein [Actinomycetota bacterium]|nr:O-antigen ligase family protein [Actinomycetota bacterium]
MRGYRWRALPSWRVDLAVDLVGALLFAGTAAWVVVAARVAGGAPGPLVDLLLVTAAAVAAGRLLTVLHDRIVPLAVAAWSGAVALRDFDILLEGPLRSPLGYNNATGAFFLVAAAAAFMVAARSTGPVSALGVGVGLAYALVPWLNGSLTAAALVVTLSLAALARHGGTAVRIMLAGGAVAVVAALAATTVVAATFDETDRSAPVDRLVDATLTQRRAVLWRDALALLRARPAFGVGVGQFGQESPTALDDRDAAWAHNAYLQMGAETGLAGLALAVAIVLWGFARLWWSPLDGATAVAGLALAAVGVHAVIDYVLHFPEVPLAAAGLVGAGSAGGRRP